MADIFLSREDKLKLQELYGVWNQHLDPKLLMEPLFIHNIITERDRQEINAKNTTYDKNEYIFDAILMKAPYEQIELIYQILMRTNTTAHKGLAARLPRRPSMATDNPEPFREVGTITVPIQATSQDDFSSVNYRHDLTMSRNDNTDILGAAGQQG